MSAIKLPSRRRSKFPHTVVHVMGPAASAGTAQARIVAALGHHLDPRRYRLRAWFLGEPGPLGEVLANANVSSRLLGFRDGSDLRGAARYAAAIATERPALLHLHVGGRSRIWPARVAPSARLVAHVHGAYAEDGSAIPLQPLVRAADALLATSKFVAKAIPGDATVVWPGVEPPGNLPASEPDPSNPIIGTVARLEPVKGIEYLLQAVAMLRQRIPRLRVELVGDGSSVSGLRALARTLDIEDSVSFLGWQEDVWACHRRWLAFVAPSVHEGFGIAALEGMASGLPVVGSATDGLCELVEHEETGFLIPVGDVEAIADRLHVLLVDGGLRKRLGHAARARALGRFGAADMARRVEAVYDRVLEP